MAAFLGFTILVVLDAVFGGFVLSTLWGWFVTPIFTQAPDLTIVSAIGIGLVVSYMTYQLNPDEREIELDEIGGLAIKSFSRALTILVFGWIAHLFM